MKDHRLKCFCLGLFAALMIGAGAPASAYDYSSADGGEDIFANMEPVDDAKLDGMRGGFVTSNGMIIDFSFTANTLVDGQLINQIALSTADLAASAASLQSIVQIGDGNQGFDGATAFDSLPNILTIVQNNLNDLTIQQLNILDLSVKNMDNFAAQSISPELDFQNVMMLAP